ncbi:MAG: tRNA uridine-5-carboxymethylaminomethyl(34) synthesis GTPase MnmE [Methylovulum sp.]|jgi:tRNA modification GTPase|nr:tRNA uridine-5-carboxymethylaminomethyl(34) synthesis GTPase MnmE [Methylovulum sp.]MCF8000159.1 tRNA uridine-5-carboxymethylaminomethyl(34) synthesis GTPase MnmE [Methylovulum sp.]
MLDSIDTIAAIATPPGNGGVGIIRISGSLVADLAKRLLSKMPVPRVATYSAFLDTDASVLDSGIVLYFPAPASYTGEDVLELHGHGGSVVLHMLLRRILSLGVRLAEPGEFTKRAFLNDKLDLAQAEAVADLIESSTEQSARSAQKSMQGVFSKQVNSLIDELIELRTYVEAAIDFVDEEIDFLTDGIVQKRIENLLERIEKIQQTAQQGRLLRDGMTLVIAGKPNAGKSSLLNVLAGHDAAIVTDEAGTTRDIIRERVQLDGMPLHIIDTAGLRESDNPVEQEGIRRAKNEINRADKVLLLMDSREAEPIELLETLPSQLDVIYLYNKIDLLDLSPSIVQTDLKTQIWLSVKTGAGIPLLINHLKQSVGYNDATESVFIARTRHLEALDKAYELTKSALAQLQFQQAGELVAEDLRQAQQSLCEITGEFHSDDLLGKIFSSFCIGK